MIHRSQMSFAPARLLLYVLIGAVFWLVAALMVRAMGTAVFTPRGWPMVLLFALSFPFGFLSLRLIGWAVGLRGAVFLPAVLVMTVTALFLDGLAFTWSTLYGLPAGSMVYGAAWILWGVGCILLFALTDAGADSRAVG